MSENISEPESRDRLSARVAELGEQLEFDRSAVASGVTAIKNAVNGRDWLTEGRGPYEWNDDNWHKEFEAASVEILAAVEPLAKIAANWKDCPQTTEEVAKARIDLKRRVAELEAKLATTERNLFEAEDRYEGRYDAAEARAVAAEAALREAREALGQTEPPTIGLLLRLTEESSAKRHISLAPQAEPADREQAISFTYGNVSIGNPAVTREMVADQYDKLHPTEGSEGK